MTHEKAARILDPETSREALDEIEYYGGFRGDEAVLEAVNEACRIAADVLRNKPTSKALTLEQLREMGGKPVWVKVIGKTGISCDGWCEVEIREKDRFAYVWWPGSEVEDIAKIEDYGKTWACYAYPPAHIDREGRLHIGRCIECLHYDGLGVCQLIGDCGGTNFVCGWFEPKTKQALVFKKWWEMCKHERTELPASHRDPVGPEGDPDVPVKIVCEDESGDVTPEKWQWIMNRFMGEK